ncbi:MAG: folate family ECF transporter S component [Defluviitaleaceae bacterium]|nr:folate family ECF transporter S component [Defluviitaleaceae bacterium]
MKTSHTKKIVLIALLISMEIVLTRLFKIEFVPYSRLSLGFIPIALMGIFFGPVYAGIGAAVADFLGVLLFAGGFPFPGLTLSAFFTGIIYGLLLHKQPIKFWRICAAAYIVTVGLQLALDTYWLTFLFDYGYIGMIPLRVLRTAIMLPVQIICIRFVAGERFRKILSLR